MYYGVSGKATREKIILYNNFGLTASKSTDKKPVQRNPCKDTKGRAVPKSSVDCGT